MMWGSGGYHSFMTSAPGIDYTGNFGAGIGLGYEFQFKRFMVHTGGEFNYLTADLQTSPFIHQQNLFDPAGNFYVGNYGFYDNNDHYTLGYVNIPLMLGFQFGRFYFLVGGKVGFNILGESSTSTRVVNAGEYPLAIKEIKKPGFPTKERTYPTTTEFEMNYGASAEVGVYLGRYKNKEGKVKRVKYRLAAFADYNFANIRPSVTTEEMLINNAEAPYYEPVLNSLMRTEKMKGQHLNNLYTGIKFTVLFNVKESVECQCAEYTLFSKGNQIKR